MPDTQFNKSEPRTDPVEVSFVLPCLNEAATIETCVNECAGIIRSSHVAGEVIVADNGSTDGSQEIAARAGARVIPVSKRGYGSALLAGIRGARGKYVVMGDSDMSYDFTQMPRFLEKLREGNELVMGCRMARGGGTILPGAMPFLHRWLGNPVLSSLGRMLFRTHIIDFHCGIRAFDRERVLALGLCTPGMEFASEMVVKASLARFRIAQVPVTLRPDGRNRPPHLRTWQDGWRHLRFMLLHAPRWLFLYPGLAILLLATAAFVTLLAGPVHFRGMRFDTNTLLVCSVGIMAGFQITLMGIFSELFSRSTGLLPPNKLVDRILKAEPFNKGILVGGPLFVAGVACLFVALAKWKNAGFGSLTYPDMLRLVTSSVIGMSLGIQIMFGGFFLGVLGVIKPSPD
jgi:glycosyltransferase involved in cell wall biosynthesis